MRPAFFFRALVVPALLAVAVASTAVAVMTVAAPSAAAATVQPGPANTGVPSGITLRRITGTVYLSKAGATYSNLDIYGRVRVTAPNITLQNSVVRGDSSRVQAALIDCIDPKTDHRGFVVKDSTLVPLYPSAYNQAGIQGHDFTVKRVEVTKTVDGVNIVGGNVTVEQSWLHDTFYVPKAQSPFGKDTHNDGVQVSSGANILITGNTIANNRNSGLMVGQDQGATSGLRFIGNWSSGGACTVNITPSPRSTMAGPVSVSSNRFRHDTAVRNCAILLNRGVTMSHDGNLWADTGATVQLTRGQ